ncbi:MAG: cation diffusion facilitator family transporter [Gammaproteobacteria bacterium]|jgi:cobalt-zinc-cadmium efflux system protein
MAHAHDHHHHSHAPSSRRVLFLALLLTIGFAGVEAVAGWISGSLALLGDAAHMLTDGLSLGLAAFASWLAARAPSRRHSYGLGQLELLAALVNALFMIAIVVMISTAAVDRFMHPRPVEGETVTLVAVIGLLINLLVAWLLSRSHQNINVRGALLHVLGDLLGSVAALISGVVITVTGWTPVDPLLSLVIVALILFSSLRLLREGLHLLIGGVPPSTNLLEVGNAMARLDGVLEVHDLHIWSLSAERTALSAHLVIDDLSHWPQILVAARGMIEERFAIDHVTLQPEVRLASDRVAAIDEPRRG